MESHNVAYNRWKNCLANINNNEVIENNVIEIPKSDNNKESGRIIVSDIVAKSEAFQKWKHSKAGEKFFNRYKVGGTKKDVFVYFTTFDDGTDYGGSQTNSLSEAETAALILTKRGDILQVTQSELIEKLQAKKDSKGRSYTINLNSGVLIIQIRLSTDLLLRQDIRDAGADILHETQHVRLFDYQKKMFGKVVLNISDQHFIMKKNYSDTFLINNKNYQIYDFRSERWNYWKEFEKSGESDEFRDTKALEGFAF